MTGHDREKKRYKATILQEKSTHGCTRQYKTTVDDTRSHKAIKGHTGTHMPQKICTLDLYKHQFDLKDRFLFSQHNFCSIHFLLMFPPQQQEQQK